MLDVRRHVLPNGLPVIVLPRPGLHAVALAFMVRGGPRFEAPADNGLSHLLEHMIFRGTASYPSSYAINAAIEAVGGEVNGYTQRDVLSIHMTVPRESATAGLELLAELCLRPRLTGLAVERDVVVEEIRDGHDAHGRDVDIDLLSRRVLWPRHPMAQPITGSIPRVMTFSEADVLRYHQRLFGAANGVLVVAGAVDPELVLQLAERDWQALPRGRRLDPPPPSPARAHAPIYLQRTEDSQVSFAFAFPAPHENDPDFTALLLLKRVLDDGFASRLRRSLVEESGLAYSASASVDAYADLAVLDLEASVSPRKLQTAVEAVLGTIRQLTLEPVSPEELARAERRHRAELEFGLDDPAELASWYGTTELVECPSSYLDRFRQGAHVTPESLLEVARRVFRPELGALTLVGPVRRSELRLLAGRLGREARLFGPPDSRPAPVPALLHGEPELTEVPIRAAG